MAIKDSIDRLKSQLLISGLQQKDPVLFQVINQLIGVQNQILNSLNSLTSGSSSSGGVT